MTELVGTKVADMIVPSEDTSTYPTHWATYGKGGYRTEATTSTRNAIKASRLEAGMQVHVTATNKAYKLNAVYPVVAPPVGSSTTDADWTEVTTSTTFLDLTDTPSSYSGQANKVVRVNAGATALEFVSPTFLSLSDTPSSYAGAATYLTRVNAAGNALEFINPALISTAVPSLQQVTTVGNTTTRPLVQNVNGASSTYIHWMVSTNGGSPITGTIYDGAFNNCIGSYYNDYSENWVSCVNFIDVSNITPSSYILKYDKSWQSTVGGDPEVYIKPTGETYYKSVTLSTAIAHEILTALDSTPGGLLTPYKLGFSSSITTPAAAGAGYIIANRGYAEGACISIGGQFKGQVKAGSSAAAYGAQFIASSLGTGSVYGTQTTVDGATSPLVAGTLWGHYTDLSDSVNRNIYRVSNQSLIYTLQGNGTNVGYYSRIQNRVRNAVNGAYYAEIDLGGTYTVTTGGPQVLYYGNYTDDNTITYNADTTFGFWARNSTAKTLSAAFKLNGTWTTGLNFADAVLTNILTHPYINISAYKYAYDDTGPFVTEQNITNLSLITGYNDKTQNTISIKDRAASAALYIERDRNGLAGTNHYAIDYRVWVNGDSAMQFAFTVGTSGYLSIHNRERSSNTGLAVYNSSSLNDGYVGYFEGQPNATNGSAIIKLNNLTSTTYGTALDISGDGANWAIDQGGKAKFLTYSSSSAPTTLRLPTGFMCYWKNTSTGKLYLCCNDGGTIKYVELTA